MPDTDQIRELTHLAEEGDAIAQNLLGAKLAIGDGIGKDSKKALYWYLEAAKAGYTHAKWNAGSMLVDGEADLGPNLLLGMQLIEEAAEANESSACLFLAQCYRQGTYGKKLDREAASAWEKKAWDSDAFREFYNPPPRTGPAV